MPSIGQNVEPFTGNGDISIEVKNSRVRRQAPNKQKHVYADPADLDFDVHDCLIILTDYVGLCIC